MKLISNQFRAIWSHPVPGFFAEFMDSYGSQSAWLYNFTPVTAIV
jgi:hypothetical protein